MISMENLLRMDAPFLSMNDMTREDWIALDFALEEYDKHNVDYDLCECKALAFVLEQIHYDKMNYYKVPDYIRLGQQFQKLAIKSNPELLNMPDIVGSREPL